jgi:tRNA dimethylallyltransferase
VPDPALVAIVGPTASGKSAAALALARERGAEIVSCDSLQVYRGFDIGSAKATPDEQKEVPHHLIDVVDPEEVFSAAEYARRARQALLEIRERGRLPIVVGGSGLYLRALFEGLFPGPPRDEGLRRRLEGIGARTGGPERLHRLLARVDPVSASRIPPRDRVRVVRALEVFRKTGRSLSSQHGDAQSLSGFSARIFGIGLPREALRKRVEARTEEMFARGFLEEVARLVERPLGQGLRPLQSIGYRQALAILRAETDRVSGARDIVTETMRYAKRQTTWFRHQPPRAEWCPSPEEALDRARGFLEGKA